MPFDSNDEYFTALRAMIERWCDERKLGALSRLLPGYVSFNGLTDGWVDLCEALKFTRSLGRDAFSSEEQGLLEEFIRVAERAVYRTWRLVRVKVSDVRFGSKADFRLFLSGH